MKEANADCEAMSPVKVEPGAPDSPKAGPAPAPMVPVAAGGGRPPSGSAGPASQSKGPEVTTSHDNEPEQSGCSDAQSDQTGTGSRKKRKYDIKYKGVYACKVSGGNYWQAQISIYGNTHHLGVFSTPEEAARAYDEQARPLGRKLNFPNDPAPPSSRPPPLLPTPRQHSRRSLGDPDHASNTIRKGPMWVNDLDDEKVAAFWRGAGMPVISTAQTAGEDDSAGAPASLPAMTGGLFGALSNPASWAALPEAPGSGEAHGPGGVGGVNGASGGQVNGGGLPSTRESAGVASATGLVSGPRTSPPMPSWLHQLPASPAGALQAQMIGLQHLGVPSAPCWSSTYQPRLFQTAATSVTDGSSSVPCPPPPVPSRFGSAVESESDHGYPF